MSFASRLSHNVLRLAKLGKHRLGGCGIGAPLLQPSQRFKHGFFIGRTLFAFGLIGLLESLHVALHRRSMLHSCSSSFAADTTARLLATAWNFEPSIATPIDRQGAAPGHRTLPTPGTPP
jgi:hypothetical protein